ncbi:MAG: glycosyltransferase [bacterium]|nr:glycosyltransferase [bacterium]
MKLLVVATEIPASSDLPGCPRLFNICLELAKRHDITLAIISNDELSLPLPDSHYLKQAFQQIVHIKTPDYKPDVVARTFHHLFFASQDDWRWQFPEELGTIRRQLEKLLQDHDSLLVRGLKAAQFLGKRPAERTVLDLGDCESSLYLKAGGNENLPLGKRLKCVFTALGLAEMERKLLSPYDVVVLISEKDARALEFTNPRTLNSVIANGVDTTYFEYHEINERDSARLLFTGLMGYTPNADAAAHFAKNIFPLIRARRPDATFQIVGAHPPAEILTLASLPGVEVIPDVHDLRPYLYQASVYVSPIRLGSGMKNKVLAAMSCGIPVVASSGSTNGIEALPMEHILVADEEPDFADSVVTLLDNVYMRSEIARKARHLVERAYSWQASASLFEALLFP